MYDYFIAGDFEVCGKVTSCLISLCYSEERANELLPKYLENPPKDCLGNIRIEKEESKKAWWNGNLD